MQRISFAPVLSATLSRDSCWIIGLLLRLLEDFHDAPPLGGRQRTRLHDQDTVADAGVVELVVGLELDVATQHLAVEGVLVALLNGDHDGLLHLVADDETLTGLARAARLGHVLILRAHTSAPSMMPSSRSRITV